ncbi:hypothetical protein XELAEV_18042400mg [Xenopus laevis]|uniref:Sulfotransferase n=1 Tax=Xenopus laevis TaxID=8355 RepID=A0A974C420_XENLA|nr:hypothetical protein XELAEV_18042400mg [Xenopus laevis]
MLFRIRSLRFFSLVAVIIFLLSFYIFILFPFSLISLQKRPVHTIILSSWRSGSSFLGQIFNHHPDVFYFFEPGHSIWNRFQQEKAEVLHYPLRDLMHSFFKCDVSPLYSYLPKGGKRISELVFFPESRALCFPPACSASYPTEVYNRFQCLLRCGDISLKRMEETLRDPRAVTSSRIHVSLTVDDNVLTGNKPSIIQIMSKICCAQVSIYNFARAAKDFLDERYMLLRYEDLAREPNFNIRKVYKFVGLQFLNHLKTLAYNMTHNKIKSDGFITYSLESESAIQKWRESMDFPMVMQIQEVCKEAMELFGYLPLQSKDDQKNPSVSIIAQRRMKNGENQNEK